MTAAPVVIGFPENIIDVFMLSLQEGLSAFERLYRPLRVTDPALSVGMHLANWAPVANTVQIGNQSEPALSRYNYNIQVLVKAADEVTGRRQYGMASKSLKAILYRDPSLVVRLTALTEELLGTRETAKRFGITRQRFQNGDTPTTGFMYLSTTEVWVETESNKLA